MPGDVRSDAEAGWLDGPHVIFDLDGTLVDSAGICARILSGMASERGQSVPIDPLALRAFLTRGGVETITAVLGQASADPYRDLEEFRRRYAALPSPPDSLYPNVREALRELRDAGFRLGVCTNKPQALCDKVISELGLLSMFEAVLGARPGRPRKPDPAVLQVYQSILGGARGPWIYVGDSEVDYAFCKATGIPFVLAAYGYHQFSELPADALIAHTFLEVPDRVRCAVNRAAG